MLLLLFLSPCINATIHIEKQSNESGRIHGNVYEASFFESPPIILAELVLETEGIKKTTHTGLLGGFQFKNLPIELTYTITASHPKYDTKVYTYTLSPDKPDLEVAMNLYRKDDSITRDINQDESCGGTIYGYTLESHDTWGAYSVPLALVDAGIKQTISGPIMGYYRITGLPFDQEITITASKKGYDSDTLKHTFTELRPTYYYCFDLQEDEDVTVKHIWNEEGTFTIMALAMNTDNSISPWETLSVTMPRNRATQTPFLNFLEQYPILYQLLQRFLQF